MQDIEQTVGGRDRQGAAVGLGDDHDPAAQDDRHRPDRQDGLHAVPQAHDPVLLALRRPGVPLQRVLLHLRRHAERRSSAWSRPATTSRSSPSATSSAPCCSARCSTPSGGSTDDRGHLHPLRACCSRTGLFLGGGDGGDALTLMGCIIFFFASAGASAAYLTASEVFPMETRALCIAFFYAIGTAVGGITGPLLFGKLIDNAAGGEASPGSPRLLHRRRADGRRRHRRGLPRRQGRGSVAREHRQAADRGGRRRRAARQRRRATRLTPPA